MGSWFVVASLAKLRDDINTLAPNRAKGADGTIGDTAHAGGGTSDHLPDEDYAALRGKDSDRLDEVHALDITTDLREAGLTLEMIVQFILARCRSGAERRLRYVIFNHRIWEADRSWVERTYTGTADPHTGHAHFSASYETVREADASSWHLEEIPVALTPADKKWIADLVEGIAARVWAEKLDIDTTAGVNKQAAGSVLAYTSSEHHRIEEAANAAVAAVKAVDSKVVKIGASMPAIPSQ